uniref:Uncharacterized protein n=1 Tax=Anguilla anguilla TaxID=7936 RepID=A0A0E9V174_ANGAN
MRDNRGCHPCYVQLEIKKLVLIKLTCHSEVLQMHSLSVT